MITLSKSGSSVTFTFDENSGYLQNGTIEVPVNSLSLVIDDSDMATFRKAASNDIFVSARYEEFGMSKAELESWYKDNMVGETGGGGGVDSGTVQTMIDESISGKADTTAVTEAISEAVSGKADISDIPDVSNYFDGAEYDSGTTRINFYHGNTIKAYIDASAFIVDGMIDDVRIETISGVTYLVIDFNTASGKEDIQIPLTDIFDPSNYYTKQEIDASLSGKADTTAVTASINAAVSGKVDTSVYTAYTAATDERIAEDEEVTAAGINAINDAFTAYTTSTDAVLSGKADTSAVTQSIAEATSGKADTTAVTASINAAVSGKVDTSVYTAYTAATDARILEDEEVTAAGLNSLNDALSGKVDTSTYSAYTAATDAVLSGKQDTLSAGTNITISGNVISAEGGGGKAISGGTNISITTGQTADTINCTLPITATTDTTNKAIMIGQSITASNTNNGCVIIGSATKGSLYDVIIGNKAKNNSGAWNHVVAIGNEAKGYSNSVAIGSYTETYNGYQEGSVAIGYLARAKNMANAVAIGHEVSTTGTTKTNINNQLKIDTSNQIYIKDKTNTNEICLQDYLQIKAVKVTQAEYDALVQGGTVDANTLYIITNVVS